MSPVDQDQDSLSTLEDRVQRAVQLVTRLRQEKEAAVATAAAARLADAVKALQAERKQVRGRIEKLLGQIDQLSGS